MRISYEWTEGEWQEAVLLANRTAVRRPGLPGMTYALVGIPLVGAVLDLRLTLHSNTGVRLAGSILPLLLLLAVTAAVGITVVTLNRRRKRSHRSGMPAGLCSLDLQETGWRCSNRQITLRPWSDLREVRQGDRVIVLVHNEGFAAIPNRSLTPDQGGHLHRLIARKLRLGS